VDSDDDMVYTEDAIATFFLKNFQEIDINMDPK
jgi:hypothetical protein